VAIPRNRVRAELLPLLERRFNPNIVGILATEATLAQAEHEYLESLAADWERTHVRAAGNQHWRADRAALASLPLALARRVLHRALEQTAGGRRIGFSDVAHALAVVTGDAAGFDAPGQRVERVGLDVVLTGGASGSSRRGRAAAGAPPFCYALAVPGQTTVPEIGLVLLAEVVPAGTAPAANEDVAVVSTDLAASGLMVRNRRPGDRLKPSAVGHRKLQDVLVDRKVPRGERDRVPLVVDGADRIVWVAGHAVDWDFRVIDPVQAVVVLRLKAVGGSF
jgi:tRNA(Ile)-lysidine synthase